MSVGALSLITRAESASTTSVRDQLLQSFRDSEYRHEFVGERVRSSVALQIRALRQARNMTQKALGDAIGMAQAWVSKLENPDYGKMTVATLLRLARAFDTDLEVKFRPFSTTIRDLPRQGPEYFDVPSFDDEFGTDELSSDEIATEIAKSGLISNIDPHEQGRRLLPTGAAGAQSADTAAISRMPPTIAQVPAIKERLYGNC